MLADLHRHRRCPYHCSHKQHRLVWEPHSNTVHQALSRGFQKFLSIPNTYSDTSPMLHLRLARRDQARSLPAHRTWAQREAGGCPHPAVPSREALFLWDTDRKHLKSGSLILGRLLWVAPRESLYKRIRGSASVRGLKQHCHQTWRNGDLPEDSSCAVH